MGNKSLQMDPASEGKLLEIEDSGFQRPGKFTQRQELRPEIQN